MGRLFNNNAANYMSRSSVNLGLNGLTECSFAFWLNLAAVNATANQGIIGKGPADGTNSILARVITNTSTILCRIEGSSTGSFPTWTSPALGTGSWTRVLFTWKRNAIAQADGVIYFNGSSQTTTFSAGGYSASTVINETAQTYYLGIRPYSITEPLNGALAWVCLWNRQLTAQEALSDYAHPRNVTSGLVSLVECGPENDLALGGSMTVNGSLAWSDSPPTRTPIRADYSSYPVSTISDQYARSV